MKRWEIWFACILGGVMVVSLLYVLASLWVRPENFLAGALLPFVVLYFKEIFYHGR